MHTRYIRIPDLLLLLLELFLLFARLIFLPLVCHQTFHIHCDHKIHWHGGYYHWKKIILASLWNC
jgi:hypothetical protein